MNVSDFYLTMSVSGINSTTPIEKRDESRLMVLNREDQSIEHKKFKNIKEIIQNQEIA